MNIKSVITAAVALLASTACSGGAKQEKVMAENGKSLVVFFSHAGDNYAVGNIEVGNTKIVVDYITEKVWSAIGYSLIEFLAHIVHITANGQLDVVLLPVEGRMDIDVPLLMQKAICGLYAVLGNHWS